MIFDYIQWLPSISWQSRINTHQFFLCNKPLLSIAHFPGLKIKQNKIKLKQNITGFLQCTSLATSPFLHRNVLKTDWYLLPLSSVLYWTHVNRICSLFGKKLQSVLQSGAWRFHFSFLTLDTTTLINSLNFFMISFFPMTNTYSLLHIRVLLVNFSKGLYLPHSQEMNQL